MLHSQTSPHDMVEKMGRGINIGNVLSAPVEGNWSPAVTEQYFIDVAAAGFTNVRIPIDFFGARTTGDTSGDSSNAGTAAEYTGTSNDYVVLNTYLDRIEQVIDWSLNQGLVTILDFHGSTLKSEFIYTFDVEESEYTEPNSAKRAADNDKFRAIWSQVADRFKDHSEDLLFEVINEPYFHMSKADMDTLNADILAIIRGSGGSNGTRNVIITGGTGTSHEAPLQIDSNIISGDSYLIATFHYYQPFNFTSSSADSRDEESWGSVQDKELLTTRFDIVSSWAASNNIPIFLGEFGADNTGGYKYSTGDLNTIGGNATTYADGGPDNASRVEYHGYIAEQAINRGFSFAAWDSGPKSNKTIHMRSDTSPASVNYAIANFSVISYNPKNTNISTVEDTSIWVEDVKDALFASGTWPLCYGSTDYIILNTGFEGGVDCNWSFNVNNDIAVASISDETTNARNGLVGAKINVTTADVYNKVILSNVPYTQDLTGKKITIKTFAKSLAANGQSFKIRINAIVNGGSQFNASSAFPLTNAYPEDAFEFEYIVPNNTTSIQVQIMLGNFTGIYFLDDFETTIEEHTTWSGATNTDWATSTNWNNGVPTNSLNASIPSGLSNYPAISVATGAAVKNLDVNASANLTIASGGSLIVSGTSSGNLTYNRNLATTIWYLVSSPVEGQDIDAFVSAEGLASGTENNLGLGDYDNSTPDWTYYLNGASGTGNFTSGDGRAIKLASIGDISFTGTINTSDVTLAMTSNSNGFNLVGNPYTSYVAGNENADGTNNILTINSANLTENTLWFWNQNTDSYNQINQASAAFQIAPAQGFFLSASGSVNLSITEAMQSHQGTDNFQRTTNRPEMNITMTNGTASRDTDIFYIDGTTTGFDNGYDSSIFGGATNEFAIYTHAVANGSGRNLGIQSLPPNNYENMIIPVGVNANAGTVITIDASIYNFPSGINIYLEDKQDNSFTQLDADTNFSTTLENSLSGIGRFYLHTTSTSLSVNDLTTSNNLSIYNTNRENLRITGVQNGTATIQLYNILGKELLRTSFEGNGVNDITLPNLANGVYIIKLATENGTTNKKIIIQ